MRDTGKIKPPRAGMGRPKGATNKATKELKDMILGALSDVGGQEYLKLQAIENPSAFMTLIGKVLPKDVNAKVEGELSVQVVTGVSK